MPLRLGGLALVASLACGAAGLAQPLEGVPFGGRGAHDASQPVEITADSLSVDQAAGTATFRGSVLVGQGALRLSADEVEVVYVEQETGTVIDEIRATGAVTLTSGAEAAEAARAVYRVADALVEMEGDVILTQGPNAVAGDRLRIDLVAGTGVIEGRVQTIIVPGGQGSPP